ncbi:MAG: DNA polymerase III subunit, partial [Elusimicrobia bacterium]|nr:DNA polymerase III subunit [Candidatus Obscuribacterium magneticum]
MKIIGQKHALRYLVQGLQRHSLSPSLLFVGPEGVGKRTVALELAKAFACQTLQTTFEDTRVTDQLPACGECPNCRKITAHAHSDLLLVDRPFQAALLKEKEETQTAIKIEIVRHLDRFLRLRPVESARRVAIIEEADRMTVDAANALLKVLEEPPPNTQIILLLKNLHNVPTTIASRCVVLKFFPVAVNELADWLIRHEHVEAAKAQEIARKADGSFSKALLLKEEDWPSLDFSAFTLDEFFAWLGESMWRKEGRKRAEKVITFLIEEATRKLEAGDESQAERLPILFQARKCID